MKIVSIGAVALGVAGAVLASVPAAAAPTLAQNPVPVSLSVTTWLAPTYFYGSWLNVTADGAWTKDSLQGPGMWWNTQGQFDSAQTSALQELATSPQLAAEPADTGRVSCANGMTTEYKLTVASLTHTTWTCEADLPTATATATANAITSMLVKSTTLADDE